MNIKIIVIKLFDKFIKKWFLLVNNPWWHEALERSNPKTFYNTNITHLKAF